MSWSSHAPPTKSISLLCDASGYTMKTILTKSKPDMFTEVHTLIELVEQAKSAGDYYAANMFFVAALHVITRNKRVMDEATFKTFFFVEVEAPLPDDADTESGVVDYYDLLNIRVFDAYTCIPMPMLHMSITAPAYRWSDKVWRGVHDRSTNPDAPDVWTERGYGYLRMGEEVAPLYLSESGMNQIADLRGRRAGSKNTDDDETESVVDNEAVFV